MSKAADDYLKLCQRDAPVPNVFEFLTKVPQLEPQDKLEVVLVDQYHRWKMNQAIPVDHYIDRLSEIEGAMVVPLLVEEYGHLEERGIAPAPADFAARYRAYGPEAYALLCEQLDLDSQSSDIESKHTIGRYDVICLIGRGAFGEVFLGRDPTLDRSVAIKVPSQERIRLEGGPAALLNEAQIVAQIDHPNIVPVYDFGTIESGGCFIVSKYVKGKELSTEVKKKLAPIEAARITAILARALHAAHQAGVVHRDVKPANIILDGQRNPHLLDFGLAVRDYRSVASTGLAGTPAYMSPEQARGDATLDGRTDIYSLAVVLYEMLAHRRPFQGQDVEEHLKQLESDEVPPPRQFVDSIPRRLESICVKALSSTIGGRFNTAGDFADDIETWLDNASRRETRNLASMRSSSNASDDQRLQLTETELRWRDYGKLPKGPSIAVLPFASPGDEGGAGFATCLSEEITTQLAKFSNLFVIDGHTTAAYQAETLDIRDAGRDLNVEFILTGSVRRSTNQLRVGVRLLNSATAHHVWSKSFHGDLNTQDLFAIESQIAQEVSTNLGLHDGVIARTRLHDHQRVASDMHAYDSVTRFYENWRSKEPKRRYAEIRRDLEATVAKDPHYTSAWAALAFAYLDAFIWDFDTEEAPERLLSLAGKAARKAVDKSPQDARALHALFRYQFHSGQIEAFLDVVERALTANPNEANMLADAAAYLACLGYWDRGLSLIRKAVALNPNPPDWYYSTECWHGLVTGDYEDALTHANRMATSGVYWAPAFKACALAHLERVEEAQQQLKILAELQPDFAQRFVREMRVWNVNEKLQAATIAGLAKAGLVPGGANP